MRAWSSVGLPRRTSLYGRSSVGETRLRSMVNPMRGPSPYDLTEPSVNH